MIPSPTAVRPAFGAALLTLFLAAVSVSAADNASIPLVKPEEVGLSSERLARIGPAMQRYINEQLVPGTVTLIARRGQIVHLEARGLADVDSNKPMTVDTIFRIASMTKPITSVALMMLYEEGRFQLHDPISKWLPEYANPQVAEPLDREERGGVTYRLVPAKRAITVRHVLTHTAGLANTYMGPFRKQFDDVAQRQSPDETVGDFVTRMASLPMNYHPGERWEYSRATDIVGRLVEVLSGQTLDEFFKQRIFEPLGMTDTHFYLPEEKVSRFAAQYRPGEDNKIVLQDPASEESRFVHEPHVYFMGAGGLVSTAWDYFRFHQMMLNGGELDGARILGRKTVELMTSNHTGDLYVWLRGEGTGFGLGYSIILDQGAAASTASEGTFGWGGAYCTYFWVDPVEELVGILMTQVRPYGHLNIRQDFQVLANQAIVD